MGARRVTGGPKKSYTVIHPKVFFLSSVSWLQLYTQIHCSGGGGGWGVGNNIIYGGPMQIDSSKRVERGKRRESWDLKVN